MAKKTTTKKAPAAKSEPSIVKMVRDAEQFPAPHTADVHPAEVENFKAGGWQEDN